MAERIIAIIETTEACNDLSQARHDKSVIFDSSLYLGHSSSCFFSSSSLVVSITSLTPEPCPALCLHFLCLEQQILLCQPLNSIWYNLLDTTCYNPFTGIAVPSKNLKEK